MLEIQSVMDRSRVVDLRDKLLTDIKVNAANELYVQYQEFSQRLETQVEQFFQANTAMDAYLSTILETKEQQLKKTLEVAKNYIELKMQVSAGKNFTYDPVLISYLQNNEVFVDKVHNMIHRLTDFKFPALLLGKDYLGLSDKIVSNDPMYVVLPESDKNHFDGQQVYQFNGTITELHELMLSLNTSYNTLKINDVLYFSSFIEISNTNVVAL